MSKFTTAPLTPLEKEKKAEAFLGFKEESHLDKKFKKEIMKPYLLKIPVSVFDELREISALTGISMNAICLDLLRPVIRRKLRDIKEMQE